MPSFGPANDLRPSCDSIQARIRHKDFCHPPPLRDHPRQGARLGLRQRRPHGVRDYANAGRLAAKDRSPCIESMRFGRSVGLSDLRASIASLLQRRRLSLSGHARWDCIGDHRQTPEVEACQHLHWAAAPPPPPRGLCSPSRLCMAETRRSPSASCAWALRAQS